MEEKTFRPSQWAMNSGAVIGLIMAAISFVLFKVNQPLEIVMFVITYPMFIPGIFFTQRLYRVRVIQNGTYRYDQALRIGGLVSLFTAIIVGFFFYVYCTYDQSMMKRLVDLMWEVNAKNQIAMNLGEEAKQSITPFTIGISMLFSFSVIGLMISFITSFFVKRTEAASTNQN